MPRLQIPNAISPQGGLTGAVRAPAEALSNTGAVQAAGAMGNAVAGAVQGIQDYRNALQNATDEAEAVRIQAEWKRDDEEMMKAQLSQGYNPDLGTDAFNVSKIAANERSKALIESNKALSKPAKRKMLLALQQKVAERDVDTSQRAFKAQRKFATTTIIESATKLYELGDFKAGDKVLDTGRQTGLIDLDAQLEAQKKGPAIYENKQMANLYYTNPRQLEENILAGVYKNAPEEHVRAMLTSTRVAVSRNQSEFFETMQTDILKDVKPTAKTFDAAFAKGDINRAQMNDGLMMVKRQEEFEAKQAAGLPAVVPWTSETVNVANAAVALVEPRNYPSHAIAMEKIATSGLPGETQKAMRDEVNERFTPVAPDKATHTKDIDDYVSSLYRIAKDFYSKTESKEPVKSGTESAQAGKAAIRDKKLLDRKLSAVMAMKEEYDKSKDMKKAQAVGDSFFKDEIPSLLINNIASKAPVLIDPEEYRKMTIITKGEPK